MDDQMRSQALDVVMVIILVSALGVGLLSMLFGRLSRLWDWFHDRYFTSSYDGSEPVPNRFDAPEPELVRAHQNQVEPPEPPRIEPVREPASLRNLSHLELTTLLAVQRNESGGYRFSANEILDFVGGTAADVKHTIREARGEQAPPAQAATGTVRRPVNGW